MWLLALPLVQPHPPARLYQRSLCRRVRGLQAVLEGSVLRVGEPVGSASLQGRELPYQRREVAGCVPGYVLRILWSHYEPSVLRHQNSAVNGPHKDRSPVKRQFCYPPSSSGWVHRCAACRSRRKGITIASAGEDQADFADSL